MSEKISNTFNSALGGAKESIGNAVGNENLAAQGATQKAEAETRSTTHKAQEQAQGVSDNITGRVKSTFGAATGNHKTEAEGHLQQAGGDIRRTLN
ncbi:hypothetical protein BGX27_002801 [Mortierella sp. AM989]|nr:hypothetical protein BGX27_002801 [Mortierella sp. AM989]